MAESKNDKKETVATPINTLKVEKLYEDAPLPVKPKTSTDSGFDVFAHNVTRIYAHYGSNNEIKLEGEAMEGKFVESGVFELQTNERALIGTGLKMTVGPGYELQVRPRSGNALKRGLTVVNTPGTIDEAYRGEVGIIIMNTSRQTQRIVLGEAIAQVVPIKVELIEIQEAELSSETKRKADGFGSTSNREKFNIPDEIFNTSINKTTPFNFM